MRKKTLFIGLALVAIAIAAVVVIRGFGSDPAKIRARADEYFAEGQYDSARLEYTNLLREDPNNAHAFQQIGYGYLEQGLNLKGIPYLFESLKHSPQNAEAKSRLASVLFDLGDFNGARNLALEVLDQVPGDEEAIRLLASTSFGDDRIAETEQRLERLDSEKQAVYHLGKAMLSNLRDGIGSNTALSSLDRALELEPDSPAVHAARASFFIVKGDKDSALTALAKASELSPVRSSARIKYASALAGAGDTAGAISQLEELTRVAPDYLPGWVALAGIELKMKEYDKALSHIEKVTKRDSVYYPGQMAKAQILLDKGDIDAASETLQKFNGAYSYGVPILKFRLKRMYSEVLIKQGRLAEAAVQLEEALQIDNIPPSNSEDAKLALAQINLSPGFAGDTDNSLEAMRALEAIVKPDGDLLTERRSPKLVASEVLLARAYEVRDRFDDAANIFRHQIKLDPTQLAPHVSLATILRAQGRGDDAIQAFEEAQRLAPGEQTIALQLMDLYLQKQDFASARTLAQTHLDREDGSEDSVAHYMMGKVLVAEKNWDEAEKSLLRALELKPDSTVVHTLLINSYIAAGKPAKAISQLESLLEKDPKNAERRMLLSLLYEKSGNIEAAVMALERLLADDPDHLPALNNLAYLTGAISGDYQKAQELADRAYALAPEDPGIADTLGWILLQRGEFTRALSLLERAAEKAPEVSEIQYHLGMARAKMGLIEPARVALEKAVATEQEYRGKEEAQERLAQLGEPLEEKTIAQLEELLAERPEDSIARVQLGTLYEKEGEHEKAAEAYSAALEVNPDLLAPLIGLARLYAGPLDDPEKALAFADRARQKSSDSAEARAVRGIVALNQGEFDYAHSLLRVALDDSVLSKDPLYQLALGQAAYGNGRIDQARQVMAEVADAASAASPEAKADATAFLALSGPVTADADIAALQAAASERLSEHPDDLAALMLTASLQKSAGQSTEALKTLKEVLERSPKFIPAMRALASTLALDPSRREEAQKWAESVSQALPDDLENTQTRGILAVETNAAAAIGLLNRVDNGKSLSPEGLFYLGKAHLAEDQKEQAAGALRRAIEAGLSGSLAEQAKDALAQAEAVSAE